MGKIISLFNKEMWKDIAKIEKFEGNIGKSWKDWKIFGKILTKFYINFEKIKTRIKFPHLNKWNFQ